MITLKKNFEFKRVLSRGKSENGKNIAIYFFPNKLNIVRYGFAIGKKAGNAVERNRIKRVIREAVRLTDIDFDKNIDIVFVWKNRVSADKVFYKDIKKEVEAFYKLLKKGKGNEEICAKSN